MSKSGQTLADTIHSKIMYSIVDQQWKKKDNTCMLFALYSAMAEKQKYVVTVCLSFED